MKTLALFVHYDQAGHVGRHVFEYIRELNRVSSQVVFITCGLDEKYRSELLSSVTKIWETTNLGYDFGKWRDYLVNHSLKGVERLILANDSCLLFRPLSPVFALMENRSDVWALTMSHEKATHLQSYFLIFEGSKAIDSVVSFLSGQPVASSREDLVERLEIGLSQHLAEQGLSLDALVTSPENFQGNITIHEWERLIKGFFHKSIYPVIKLKNFTEHKILYPELSIQKMKQVVSEELTLPDVTAEELLRDF